MPDLAVGEDYPSAAELENATDVVLAAAVEHLLHGGGSAISAMRSRSAGTTARSSKLSR